MARWRLPNFVTPTNTFDRDMHSFITSLLLCTRSVPRHDSAFLLQFEIAFRRF